MEVRRAGGLQIRGYGIFVEIARDLKSGEGWQDAPPVPEVKTAGARASAVDEVDYPEWKTPKEAL